jgi:mono/diheme cytochrome c family protein
MRRNKMSDSKARHATYQRALLALIAAASLLTACQTHEAPASGEAESRGWAGAPLDSDPEQVAAGKQIAERECAQCHAIDATSKSPNATAPPLRDVLSVNDADNLAYRFIEAMRVGHDEMPLFDFDVRSADALIAYIASISG